MLFEIDESISELFASGAAEEQDIEAFSCLVLGAAEGNHKIVGRRRVLAQLARLDTLNIRPRRALERALAHAAQEGSLSSRLPVSGRVVANAKSIESALYGGRRIITFPLRWFDITAKIQPTTLLAENLSDFAVFKLMGAAGALLASLGHIPFRAIESNGGGNTVGAVLGNLATTERICLCIVDSDKACPESQTGATAQTVEPFKDATLYPSIGVFETVGRDLENSLPNSFYNDAYGQNRRYAPMARLLLALTRENEHDVRLHIDIEKGLTLHDVRRYAANSPEALFWQSKIERIIDNSTPRWCDLACLGFTECPHQRRSDCLCIVVPGNHSDILRDFAEHHKHSNGYMLCRSLDNSVRAEWIRLGAIVASWCCGDSPVRI